MVASIVQFDCTNVVLKMIQVALEIAPLGIEHSGNWLPLQRGRRPRCIARCDGGVLALERIQRGPVGQPELLCGPFAAAAEEGAPFGRDPDAIVPVRRCWRVRDHSRGGVEDDPPRGQT
ncbi:MAG: hypothetical protein BGO51_06475 [Rhodospirillales bacterium 69-11]|nr:MAG: hypothetical protein BGO51_06475 [Rhodospirillales bacterium 69-11]